MDSGMARNGAEWFSRLFSCFWGDEGWKGDSWIYLGNEENDRGMSTWRSIWDLFRGLEEAFKMVSTTPRHIATI